MPYTNAPDMPAKLARLRERFLVRLSEDLECLQKEADRLGSDDDSGALCSAYHRLHRLAGSAGTFGMPDVGRAARALEKVLKPVACIEDESRLDSGHKARLFEELSSGLQVLRSLAGHQTSSAHDASLDKANVFDRTPLDGKQARLLIVDEDTDRASLLCRELSSYGFDSLEVSVDAMMNAIDCAENSGVVALLASPVQVPKVRTVRNSSSDPAILRLPIFAVGGHDSFDNRYELAENGARGFFPDPIQLPELVERIEKLSADQARGTRGRVILVEDDPDLAEHYRLVLHLAGIDVRIVNDPTRLLSDMAAFRPDLVLMDVQLDGYSGVHLARMIRFDAQWLSLPIIYLSSEDDPDIQLDALSKGADDFLMKPVSDDYLVRSVQIRCLRARLLSDLMNQDSLTGLLKHSLIKQTLEQEVARCRRDGHTSAVVMLDLDHFKTVNDTWGHMVGDTVIKSLANLLRNRLRETDLIGRYGGEEFLVVMPGCDLDDAERVMQDIAASFSALVFTAGQDRFHVTLSAGIAAIHGLSTADESLNAADAALYRRKYNGRNGVTVFRSGPQNAPQEAH